MCIICDIVILCVRPYSCSVVTFKCLVTSSSSFEKKKRKGFPQTLSSEFNLIQHLWDELESQMSWTSSPTVCVGPLVAKQSITLIMIT